MSQSCFPMPCGVNFMVERMRLLTPAQRATFVGKVEYAAGEPAAGADMTPVLMMLLDVMAAQTVLAAEAASPAGPVESGAGEAG